MSLLRGIAKELAGLFLDDEFLAVAALVVVAIAALLVKALGLAPLVAGAVLLGGSVGALLTSIRRTARAR